MKPLSLWQRLQRRLQPPPSRPATAVVPAPAPVAPAQRAQPAEPQPSPHKQLRDERREQLNALVREAMLRGGILSTAYKFRALTLDRHGEHFIVLFDLDGHDLDTRHSTLNALELTLQTLVQERHPPLQVKHVYWRVTDPDETTDAPRPSDQPDFAPTQPMMPHGGIDR